MSPPRHDDPSRIFLLPNLMTAGNLIFGFLAVLKIFEGTLQYQSGDATFAQTYETSLKFILGACLCDLLDGRLARLGGSESPFGREFDSLADIVSFGVAPALLVFKIVLVDISNRIGWIIAVFYLLCGALRLARFNVASTYNLGTGSRNFSGFPIPAAAGLISSITLFILWHYKFEQKLTLGNGKYVLVALMIFLSFMMFSKFEYPSFKGLNWRTQFSLPKFMGAVLLLGLNIIYYEWMPAIMFVAYLLYGFLRPFISRAWRREIEDEDEVAEAANPGDDSGLTDDS
jgi:CDP-diacylglycerol---serine O-phosphatidyltransferase